MKATRKLLPAIALLLVSVVLLSTASFAWFTTNKTVKTTMTVSVTTPQNLMISTDGGDTWANSAAFNADDAYPELVPASSANAIDFVVSSGLLTEGALDQDAIDAIVDGTDLGSFENITTAYVPGEDDPIYFLTYSFQLRAAQPIDATTSKVTCEVTVASADSTDEGYFEALRIVILNAQNQIVFATRGAESTADCYPIVKDGDADFKLSTSKYEDADTFASITFEAAIAQSYTLVVWLEGNDPACISSNVDDNPDCDISIDFEVESIERQ